MCTRSAEDAVTRYAMCEARTGAAREARTATRPCGANGRLPRLTPRLDWRFCGLTIMSATLQKGQSDQARVPSTQVRREPSPPR